MGRSKVVLRSFLRDQKLAQKHASHHSKPIFIVWRFLTSWIWMNDMMIWMTSLICSSKAWDDAWASQTPSTLIFFIVISVWYAVKCVTDLNIKFVTDLNSDLNHQIFWIWPDLWHDLTCDLWPDLWPASCQQHWIHFNTVFMPIERRSNFVNPSSSSSDLGEGGEEIALPLSVVLWTCPWQTRVNHKMGDIMSFLKQPWITTLRCEKIMLLASLALK